MASTAPHLARAVAFVTQFAGEPRNSVSPDWDGSMRLRRALQEMLGLRESEWSDCLRLLDARAPEWLRSLALDAAIYGLEITTQRWKNAWMLWKLAYPLPPAPQGLWVPDLAAQYEYAATKRKRENSSE